MIAVLSDSGYDMEEVVEDFDTDPEDAAWRDMERDYEAVRSNTTENRCIRPIATSGRPSCWSDSC